MSGTVFLDTSAWFAAVDRRDARHADAAATHRDLIARRVMLHTSNLVVAELHALVLRRHGIATATRLLDGVSAEQLYSVHYVDRDLETASVDRWIRPFRDQRFSLTDAVSFEIMRREGIRTAFALDRHFASAGFELLLG